MSTYLIIALVSYLLGSIPFGYILVRIFLKQDIRQTGSGNIGATNVARSGAKGLAIATLILDTAKGTASVIIAGQIWFKHLRDINSAYMIPGLENMFVYPPGWFNALALAAFFAVVGHMFPPWLKFRGGKGVATAIGAFGLVNPVAALATVVVFGVVVALSRYVSLGSVSAAFTFPLFSWLLARQTESLTPYLTLIALTSLLIILKHHANIRRLLAGTEPKLGAKPTIPPPEPMEKRA